MNPRESAILWTALSIAFAPVIVNLGRYLAAFPAGCPALVAPILIAFCLARGIGRGAQRRRTGVILLLLGGALEIVGIAGGSWSIARFGFPIAFLGAGCWTGMLSPRVAALAFWLIPIPEFVFDLTTPNLESAVLEHAASLARIAGIHVHTVGPVASAAEHHFELESHDTGIRVAFVLSEFGWLAGVLRGARPIQLALESICVAALAVPVQLFGVAIAIALLAAGWPGVADGWLHHGIWLATALGSALCVRARSPLLPVPRATSQP